MIVVMNTDDDGKYDSKWRDVKESYFGLLSAVWQEMMQAGDITEVRTLHWQPMLSGLYREYYVVRPTKKKPGSPLDVMICYWYFKETVDRSRVHHVGQSWEC